MTRPAGLAAFRDLADPACADCEGVGAFRSETVRQIEELSRGWDVRDTYTLTVCMCTGSKREFRCTGAMLVTDESELQHLTKPHDVALEMLPIEEAS